MAPAIRRSRRKAKRSIDRIAPRSDRDDSIFGDTILI
jgi:hypothetical protein